MFPWVLSNDFLSPRCSFIIPVMTLFVKEFLIRRVRAVSRETLTRYRFVLLRCVSPLGGTEGGLHLVFLLNCVICHEVFQFQHSRKICAYVLGCGLLLSLGVRRVQFAAQAPIFGFKCFFGYGCFCFHFLHLYMFFAIGLLAFVSRRRCQRLCPFSFQHYIKRVSREKA